MPADAVFDDLIERMPVPFVLSHSSAKAIYNHPRNLDDARLKRLAKAGGVIQVNAYGGYLIDTAKSEARKAAETALMAQLGTDYDGMSIQQGVALKKGLEEIDQRIPLRKATLDDFFAHFEHILTVVGPEHVGIGLDWDGGGGLADLPDVSQLPKITAWLLRKGYSEKQIAGIWGGNLLRVMQQAQDHAAKVAAAEVLSPGGITRAARPRGFTSAHKEKGRPRACLFHPRSSPAGGRRDRSALAQHRIATPVGEVGDQAQNVPRQEPQLRGARQAEEQVHAADDRQRADHPGQRRAEHARRLRLALAQHQQAHGHRGERGQRAGVGQRGDLVQARHAGQRRHQHGGEQRDGHRRAGARADLRQRRAAAGRRAT